MEDKQYIYDAGLSFLVAIRGKTLMMEVPGGMWNTWG